jgi:hypothetical protein
VEGEYHTGAQEQLYIENNGIIAECFRNASGAVESVCVRGCMQCPYYVVHALTLVFNLPEEKCRVIQVETGGAFGGKEDFPSVIGSHAALLAMKCGHPVKIIYDRAEDMAATTKRHPSRTRHRTAVSKDGKLLAGTIDVAIDGGAYSTLSPVVLSRATIHAPGPYKWPHIRVKAKAMATNIPPHGPFAASARRSRSSVWSATWTRSRRPSGSRRRSCAAATSSRRETRRRRPAAHREGGHAAPAHTRARRGRLPREARALCRGEQALQHQARRGLCGVHARHGLYRLRRAAPQLAGVR